MSLLKCMYRSDFLETTFVSITYTYSVGTHNILYDFKRERESGFRSYLDIGAEGQSGLSGQKTGKLTVTIGAIC